MGLGLFIAFLWALSCALSPTAAAGKVTYPVTFEVDLVFPGNDTYAPAPVFPVVFAAQNLAAAWPTTEILLSWSLLDMDRRLFEENSTILPNTNSSDPYYINGWTGGLNTTVPAGTYVLEWGISYNDCPDSRGNTGRFTRDYLIFTIEHDAQQPDLTAVLKTCPVQNTTFAITGTKPERHTSPSRGVIEACGIISDTPPPPANPCAAKVDSAVASSISAALTASACAASPPVLTSGCPPPPPDPTPTGDKNGGSRVAESGITSALLAGLLLLLVMA
ncbi:hypothetical protein C8A00DRAFT_29731 [Chaetomidium leptoderma]|uniref:DUF7136 domain-containing protein n=1 Tax=Chaetomidium leptoderma TaxID=669021 RepID=A0AAN6VW84_9PEZI|nr:hypothetical protein C8A00DRAFT_29731 [Chaetomidium leptoderma]